jgi:hypothetical protein
MIHRRASSFAFKATYTDIFMSTSEFAQSRERRSGGASNPLPLPPISRKYLAPKETPT